MHSFSSINSLFYFYMFLLSYNLTNSLQENSNWTANKLTEKFGNKNFVDTNNYLDLPNQVKESIQISSQIKTLEEMGYKINIYIIDFIPEQYSDEYMFKKYKNTEAYLKDLIQLLHEKYNQDKSKTIVAVFALFLQKKKTSFSE